MVLPSLVFGSRKDRNKARPGGMREKLSWDICSGQKEKATMTRKK